MHYTKSPQVLQNKVTPSTSETNHSKYFKPSHPKYFRTKSPHVLHSKYFQTKLLQVLQKQITASISKPGHPKYFRTKSPQVLHNQVTPNTLQPSHPKYFTTIHIYLIRIIHGKCHSASSIKVEHSKLEWSASVFWSEADLQLSITRNNKICRPVL